MPELRRLGLATAGPKAGNASKAGIIVEVFEWQDGAIEAAHANPDILAIGSAMPPYATPSIFRSLPKRAMGSHGLSLSTRPDPDRLFR